MSEIKHNRPMVDKVSPVSPSLESKYKILLVKYNSNTSESCLVKLSILKYSKVLFNINTLLNCLCDETKTYISKNASVSSVNSAIV